MNNMIIQCSERIDPNCEYMSEYEEWILRGNQKAEELTENQEKKKIQKHIDN